MIEYRIEHEFATTPDAYWEMFFSDAYNEALWPALDIERVQISFRRTGEGQDEQIHRTHKLVPRRNLPPVIARLVEGGVAYEERNVWTRKTSSMTVEVIPNYLAGKLKSGGTYSVKTTSPGRVARIWDGHCNCKIPLIGRPISEHIVAEVRRSYELTTQFTREWLERRSA